MELHTLKPAKNAIKQHKRLGRGQGSGKGGTATRGHKGAKSRSGYKTKVGFEGGQLPLQRRLPRYGFKNPNRVMYKPINLTTLDALAEKHNLSIIDLDVLRKYGLISKHDLCKVLAKGTLQRKLDIAAHAFSETAINSIKKLGGQVQIIKTYA
jgi:large subunit ribosomal protein L15